MAFAFTGYRNSGVTFFDNGVQMLNDDGGALINARALSFFLY